MEPREIVELWRSCASVNEFAEILNLPIEDAHAMHHTATVALRRIKRSNGNAATERPGHGNVSLTIHCKPADKETFNRFCRDYDMTKGELLALLLGKVK